MPASYNKLDLTFQYPDNWTLDEKDALEGESTVTVYSPGGAFWSIVVHPAQVDPEDLAKTALKAMRKEYDELDSEPVREAVGGHELLGYDLNFYCLDLTNTALVRAFRTPAASYLILCQADDREFQQIEAVFRAITASLVGGLAY